jgi:hypothetical protein
MMSVPYRKAAGAFFLFASLSLLPTNAADAQKLSGKKDKDFDAAAAFEQLKRLEGVWEADWAGRTYGDAAKPVIVSYEVTSDGSVVTEVSNEGAPEEMTSKFFLADGDLVVEHFCAMGNQPRMKLNNGGGGKGKKLGFAQAGGTNLKNKIGYMVLISINEITPDHLETVWQTRTPDDKVGGTHTVTLKRRATS